MKNNYSFFLLLLSNFVCLFVQAAPVLEKQQSPVQIKQAYIRATIPGTSISSSYMEIENKNDTTATLLSVISNISPRIEIHQHTMLDGMMRMRKLDSIDIPPKGRVKLQPSGLHLMLFNVKTPLKEQQLVELTLNFSNKESVSIQVPVYSPSQEKALQHTAAQANGHNH